MTEPISITLPADSRTGWFDVRNAEVAGRSMYAIVRRGDLYLKARVTIPHAAGDAGLAPSQSRYATCRGLRPAPTQLGQN